MCEIHCIATSPKECIGGLVDSKRLTLSSKASTVCWQHGRGFVNQMQQKQCGKKLISVHTTEEALEAHSMKPPCQGLIG